MRNPDNALGGNKRSNRMNGLMLHCGGKAAAYDDVLAVPVPQHTNSWRPVAYADAIDYVRDCVTSLIGRPIRSEAYGLAREGRQLFSVLTVDTEETERGLSIGLRQSYDKSLSLGVAIGASVFVCDNMCFSGSAAKVLRKNTARVWEDARQLITEQLRGASAHYEQLSNQIARMGAVPCHTDRGYAMLGVMAGHGLLSPRQLTVALGEWAEATHELQRERTLWGLYNATTAGLKLGSPGGAIERHTKAHDFIVERV
jgi:hypothetical protein